MKVSVVTVAYNAAATIEDTLKSVEMQSHGDVEYVVIDGGSTDGTLDILGRYAHIVSVLVSEPDKGIYDAMNKGLALCTGEVVGILNSDDTYAYADVIADVVARLEFSGADACYADLHYVDRHNPEKTVRRWKSGPYRRSAFRRGWMPPHPTFFLRRKAYLKYGMFGTSMRISSDYELMVRMLYKHGLSATYLPKVTVKMKTGGESNVSLRNRFSANREDLMAWRLNGYRKSWLTVWMKPLRKIGQFLSI